MVIKRMAIYKYYNQNNYPNVPYPSPTLSNATVKSGGCGAVCGAMIVSNLTDKIVDPIYMAQYAIKKGARVSGGTDLNILSKAICLDYGLIYKTTNNESILLDHLKNNGMAIANVGGNRSGYIGVFSDGGHFITCAGLSNDGKVIVLDPGYYVGKFNKTGRVGKIKVNGNECICDISVLAKDTENRSPAYWLFDNKNKIIMEVLDMFKDIEKGRWSAESIERLNKLGLMNGYKDNTFRPTQALTREEFAYVLDKVLKMLGK